MRTALVVGATSNIGFEAAKLFINNGHKAILTSRDINKLSEIYSEYSGRSILLSALDIRDNLSIKDLHDEVSAFGYPDIIVYVSGVSRDGFFLRMNEEKWNEVIDTNLNGCYRVIRQFIRPMMKKRWGRIINISSVAGKAGNVGQTNYSASKAGIIGFTMSLAKEMAPWNITCNSIAPGLIGTNMTRDMDSSVLNEIIDRIPLKRMGRPEEVGSLIYFLAQNVCGYVTGETISIDGGLYMN